MVPKAMDFTDAVAIVTGAGCQTSEEVGNGRAVAILLARHGAKVVLVDLNLAWAEETKRMIEEEDGVSLVVQADVSQEASCKHIVEQAVTAFGSLSLLVNNVGVTGAMGDSTNIDLDGWDLGFRINVKSMVMMARYAIPEMRKAGGGAILNMASVSGFYVEGGALLYPSTKGAVIQMTKAMAAQHGPEGIRVNCVCPGAVYTPMVQGAWMTESMRKSRADKTLLKQEGTGWDIGYAALFLLSKEARWITGHNLIVDGGATVGQSKPIII